MALRTSAGELGLFWTSSDLSSSATSARKPGETAGIEFYIFGVRSRGQRRR